jgi:hypothetical protein
VSGGRGLSRRNTTGTSGSNRRARSRTTSESIPPENGAYQSWAARWDSIRVVMSATAAVPAFADGVRSPPSAASSPGVRCRHHSGHATARPPHASPARGVFGHMGAMTHMGADNRQRCYDLGAHRDRGPVWPRPGSTFCGRPEPVWAVGDLPGAWECSHRRHPSWSSSRYCCCGSGDCAVLDAVAAATADGSNDRIARSRRRRRGRFGW